MAFLEALNLVLLLTLFARIVLDFTFRTRRWPHRRSRPPFVDRGNQRVEVTGTSRSVRFQEQDTPGREGREIERSFQGRAQPLEGTLPLRAHDDRTGHDDPARLSAREFSADADDSASLEIADVPQEPGRLRKPTLFEALDLLARLRGTPLRDEAAVKDVGKHVRSVTGRFVYPAFVGPSEARPARTPPVLAEAARGADSAGGRPRAPS